VVVKRKLQLRKLLRRVIDMAKKKKATKKKAKKKAIKRRGY